MTTANVAEDTDFVKFWNEVLAPKFVRFKHVLVDGLTQHSEQAMPLLPVKSGDAVLDVGCGFGDTAIQLAGLVGPSGRVVGVDCTDAFLEFARKDAAEKGIENVSFMRGDAEIALPEGEFDFVFARFGTMFFTNPVPALRNMRTALKPGGRMAHIVWRTRADNPWADGPKEVVSRFVPPLGEDAATCGPGPFSMADQEMVTGQMKAAGYTDIAFHRIDAPFVIGRDPDDAIEFQIALGPAGELYREGGDVAIERHGEIVAALKEWIAEKDLVDERGVVTPSSSWVITATNPA